MAATSPSFLSKVRPSINQAMVVTMAVIWEEAIDSASGHADLHSLIGHALNSLLVTFLCVLLKVVTQSFPKTSLLTLIITTFQTLTGWMWKAVVNELIDFAHEPIASGIVFGNATVPPSAAAQAGNEGIMWGCTGVSFLCAMLTTLLGISLLRFLPLLPAPTVATKTSALVAFHLVGTLCGGVTLPIAFSWHYVIFNGASSLVLPRVASPGLTDLEPGVHWLLFVIVLIFLAVLVGFAAGSVRSRAKAWLSTASTSKGVKEGHVKRYEPSVLKTLDFLLAWMIFAVFQSSHQPIGASACFPTPTPHILSESGVGLGIVFTVVILLVVALFVVLKAHFGARADAKPASLTPEASACVRTRAHGWTVAVGTLGILLGWAVKDVYDALLDAILEAAEGGVVAKSASHGGALGALVLTIVVLAGASCAKGDCTTKKPATVTRTVANIPTPAAQVEAKV